MSESKLSPYPFPPPTVSFPAPRTAGNEKGNNLIKVITGIRRSRKSFLLFELIAKHLKESG